MATNQLERVPVSELLPWDKNPRRIKPDRLEALKRSISEDPEMLDARPLMALRGVDYVPDGTVIGGNQRLQAAKELGIETLPVMFFAIDEARAKTWALRDNVGYGEWEDQSLADILRELEAQDIDLDLTGFGQDDIAALYADVFGPPEPAAPPEDRGTDLQLADVSIGDPKHVCEKGDVWRLSEHLLVVEEVYDGWQSWVKYLDDETMLLVPYPTPTLPLTVRASKHRLLMVQPDKWCAGHVIDKFAAVRGEDSVSKVEA